MRLTRFAVDSDLGACSRGWPGFEVALLRTMAASVVVGPIRRAIRPSVLNDDDYDVHDENGSEGRRRARQNISSSNDLPDMVDAHYSEQPLD